MTTRRQFLALLGAGAAATAAGCSSDAGTVRLPGPAPDPLLLRSSGGLTVLRDGTATGYGAAVVSPTGYRLYQCVAAGDGTDLRQVDLATGRATTTDHLSGAWEPKTASPTGQRVALAPPGSAGVAGIPAGRSSTDLLICGPTAPRPLRLPGNYVPEAFSTTEDTLFVLDWRPAAPPTPIGCGWSTWPMANRPRS